MCFLGVICLIFFFFLGMDMSPRCHGAVHKSRIIFSVFIHIYYIIYILFAMFIIYAIQKFGVSFIIYLFINRN